MWSLKSSHSWLRCSWMVALSARSSSVMCPCNPKASRGAPWAKRYHTPSWNQSNLSDLSRRTPYLLTVGGSQGTFPWCAWSWKPAVRNTSAIHIKIVANHLVDHIPVGKEPVVHAHSSVHPGLHGLCKLLPFELAFPVRVVLSSSPEKGMPLHLHALCVTPSYELVHNSQWNHLDPSKWWLLGCFFLISSILWLASSSHPLVSSS